MPSKNLSAQIGNTLRKKRLSLAVAESCTGGFLSHCITNTPGSSDYFIGALLAYQNRVKNSVLGVPLGTLKKHGAVSLPTALGMAKNVAKLFHADWGIGITGIAGPSGGSKKKPVGLVYIAVSGNNRTIGKKFIFSGSRRRVKTLAANAALNFLRLRLRAK